MYFGTYVYVLHQPIELDRPRFFHHNAGHLQFFVNMNNWKFAKITNRH